MIFCIEKLIHKNMMNTTVIFALLHNLFIFGCNLQLKVLLYYINTFVRPVWTVFVNLKVGGVVKYIIILADGLADEPLEELCGMTPMEIGKTPVMDALAARSELGLTYNVPKGMKPGSDVANLSVLGYDPRLCYSGRSSLEALSVGVPMDESDIIFRCNLVTLSEEEPYPQKTIIDHSSGEITTEEADVLMESIREAFNTDMIRFYTGTSYREITVWKQGSVLDLEPPHDHLGCVIGPYLPKESIFREMMEKSFEVLNNHPLNLKREKEGKRKANSLWFWGAGTKPSLENFEEKTGLKGAMISAVDLLKGIAVGAGMKVLDVPGANGGLNTNYEGKADAAVSALLEQGCDLAYIHVEAPDEMGHSGSIPNKMLSAEYIDRRVVGRVLDKMNASRVPYRLLILPDHPTPIRCRTHTTDPVPYLLYDYQKTVSGTRGFNEKTAAASGNVVSNGYELLNKLISD